MEAIRFVKIITVALMVFLTIVAAASGVKIDQNDEFYIQAGDSKDAGFVVHDIDSEEVTVNTTSDILSFDRDSWTKEKFYYDYQAELEGEGLYVPYHILTSENTTNGLYRETIDVYDGDEKRVFNVKVKVQNNFFNEIYYFFKEPRTIGGNPVKTKMVFMWVLLIVSIVFIAYSYFGFRRGRG